MGNKLKENRKKKRFEKKQYQLINSRQLNSSI